MSNMNPSYSYSSFKKTQISYMREMKGFLSNLLDGDIDESEASDLLDRTESLLEDVGVER